MYICIEIVSTACSRRFKDTHREKAPWTKTPALAESINMDIWVVGTSSQLFIAGSYTETKFSEKKKWILAKLCSLWQVHFEKAILYGYVRFSLVVLSTRKRFSSFFKKRFSFFRKFVSKLKYWKHSKFPAIVT